MYTYVSLPVTLSGCRVLSNRVEVHNTHHHITGGLTVSMYKNTIFRTFRAPQKRCCSLSPPERRIIIVGFLPDNNGRSCALHPFGCGNIVVLQRGDGGVGMLLHVRMIVNNELACFSLNPDGSDGCCVAFAAREYAAGENGQRFDGALVRLVAVYSPDDENSTVRRLYHCNRGYAVGKIVQLAHAST